MNRELEEKPSPGTPISEEAEGKSGGRRAIEPRSASSRQGSPSSSALSACALLASLLSLRERLARSPAPSKKHPLHPHSPLPPSPSVLAPLSPHHSGPGSRIFRPKLRRLPWRRWPRRRRPRPPQPRHQQRPHRATRSKTAKKAKCPPSPKNTTTSKSPLLVAYVRTLR